TQRRAFAGRHGAKASRALTTEPGARTTAATALHLRLDSLSFAPDGPRTTAGKRTRWQPLASQHRRLPTGPSLPLGTFATDDAGTRAAGEQLTARGRPISAGALSAQRLAGYLLARATDESTLERIAGDQP